jgi:peptidoglycan/xylan/chitin deacetylase (PgdA/CDA1 family)
MHALKRAVKAVVATRPGFLLARRQQKPGCIVFVYHRVGVKSDPFPNLDVSVFRAQIQWLTRNCNVVAPEDLRDRALNARNHSRRPDVLITFDDGYRDYYEHAYPVLRDCRVRALNFLCTRFVDDPTLVGWWDRLYLAVGATTAARAVLPWANDVYELDADGRAALLRAAKTYIKSRPQIEEQQLTHAIFDALRVDPAQVTVPRQTMNWDEVRAAAEFTCYGGHTHNHVIVSRLTSSALTDEVLTCRDRISAETGTTPDTFAYPNGREIDFSEEAKAVVQRSGFHTAFSTIDGINGIDTDWLAVRRIACGRSVADLAWRLSRIES